MVDLDQEEVPIMDGSSSNFVFLLVSAGIVEQDKPKKFIKIKKPIRVEKEGKFVEFKPGPNSEFRFSMDFDHPFLKQQKLSASIMLSSDSYIREISRARTFGFMRDIEYLKTLGLARGASLDNAVGIKENCIANKNGLRYEDEFVKHKILDALGDLYVSGYSLIGVYEAFKSGHELNNISIRTLLDNKEAYEYVTFEEDDSEMPISYSICA
jgi:UDP-3-O-[3-hydroxymyristoyl] N-acetylglucosamine deacetylase